MDHGTSRLWTQVLKRCRTGVAPKKQQTSPVFQKFSNQQQQQQQQLSVSDAIQELQICNRQVSPSEYISLLRQCIANRAIEDGRRVHAHIISQQSKLPTSLANLLLQLYTRCSCLEEARSVFDTLQQRNIISWTSMLGGYVHHGRFAEALDLFRKLDPGIQPDAYVFTIALAACSSLGDLQQGRAIHARCCSQRLAQCDVVLDTALVNMYAKCGSIGEAKMVFDSMKIRDSVSWNAMITAYAQNGHCREAMDLYLNMAAEGMEPSDATFLSVLSVSSSLSLTRSIHQRFLASGIQSSDVVTSLVTAYGRCNSLGDARQVFYSEPQHKRTLFQWTALLAAYARRGHNKEALELFNAMCEEEGLEPDSYTYSLALMVCANMECLNEGRAVHLRVSASRFQQEDTVVASLINMYAKCGRLDDARDVFDRAGRKSSSVWNAMLSGCMHQEKPREALDLYHRMLSEEEPTTFTFSIVLGACAALEALEDGKSVHQQIVAGRMDSDTVVLNSLVKMYAMCGSMEQAMEVFEKAIRHSDAITWNAMIVALARFGHGRQAIELYHRMQLQGIEPTQITLTAVLTACGHAGLLSRFQSYFNSMISDFAVQPVLEHYECIADLMSRSGRLIDAQDLLQAMPFYPAAAPWRSLLGACRVHNNVEIAIAAAEEVMKLEPEDHTAYVLLSNVYTNTNTNKEEEQQQSQQLELKRLIQ